MLLINNKSRIFAFCNSINRNYGMSREQSKACLSYAEAKPKMPSNRNLLKSSILSITIIKTVIEI